MVNYDFYHRYTADEHSMRMIRFLEQLADSGGTGSLELAEIYEDEAERAITSAVKLIEPLLIVIVGGIVGGIVAAVMLPIFEANTMVS